MPTVEKITLWHTILELCQQLNESTHTVEKKCWLPGEIFLQVGFISSCIKIITHYLFQLLDNMNDKRYCSLGSNSIFTFFFF